MKPIHDGHTIKPFKTKKFNQINYVYGVTTGSSVFIDEASANIDIMDYDRNADVVNNSGISKLLLSSSVLHTFYSSGSRGIPISPYTLNYYPSPAFYVINIIQQRFGEKVSPGSFLLYDSTSSIRYVDDSNGRVIVSGTNNVVGNIFYGSGVVVIGKSSVNGTIISVPFYNPSSYFSEAYFNSYFLNSSSSVSYTTSGYNSPLYFSPTYFGSYFLTSLSSSSLVSTVINTDGLYLQTNNQINIQFASQHTIYEHEIICTMEAGEMNFSTNPTIKSPTLSGSYSQSVFVQDTGSLASDLVFSGTLQPYFTTIGLYNDVGEMLAVAKMPQPIKRVTNTQQTVIIRFDA